MIASDWPADDYAIGSYIQAKAAESYFPKIKVNPDDRILDIGCGNGVYSQEVLKLIPEGELVGIDASASMLALASKIAEHHPQFSVQKADMHDLNFENEFDDVVSFWCLHWTRDIQLAFKNIQKALKPGGRFYTLCPSGDDPFIRSYDAIKASGEFKVLDDFNPSMNYAHLDHLSDQLYPLSFHQLTIDRTKHAISLPDLETYRRFVYGLGYYQGQIDDEMIPKLNDAMVQWFESMCQKNHGGNYIFDYSAYWITGIK